MKPSPNDACLCGSTLKYKRCCGPLHDGVPARTPEALMRSRYAAYALGKVDYVLTTTDPDGPQFERDAAAWRASVAAFSAGTQFLGLTVLATAATGDVGEVTFHVRLTQAGRDASFGETSRFTLRAGRWFYHSGQPLR